MDKRGSFCQNQHRVCRIFCGTTFCVFCDNCNCFTDTVLYNGLYKGYCVFTHLKIRKGSQYESTEAKRRGSDL